MKCTACENKECEGKYENREKCVGAKEKIKCTCLCQVTKKDAIIATVTSVGTGVAAAAAGVGLTVMTGGLAAVIGGAAIMGGGSSLILSPIQKYLSGEQVTVKESAKDAALGATIGAVTGPIGFAGSKLAQGASVLARFGYRSVAGSAAGAVSGAVSEGARYMKGEDVSLKSVGKSVGMGAVVGSIGGASSQFATSASSSVTNEIGQVATRIGVQGASAAATDAGLQLYQNGTIDAQQLILNTTGQLTVATTAEISSSMAQRTTAYNNKLNNEQLKNLPPDEANAIKKVVDEANSIDKKALAGGNKVGDKNLHVLERDRSGQVAGDIGPAGDNGKRGAGRVILENHKGKYVVVDHTMEHDYKGCKASADIKNPLDSTLRTNRVDANTDGCDDVDDENILNMKTNDDDVSILGGEKKFKLTLNRKNR